MGCEGAHPFKGASRPPAKCGVCGFWLEGAGHEQPSVLRTPGAPLRRESEGKGMCALASGVGGQGRMAHQSIQVCWEHKSQGAMDGL